MADSSKTTSTKQDKRYGSHKTNTLKLCKLYPTPELLQARIDKFFEEYRIDTLHKPTLSRLCVYLGVDYDTWLNYLHDKQSTIAEQWGVDSKVILGILTRAKLRCIAEYEDMSHTKDMCRGALAAMARMGVDSGDVGGGQVRVVFEGGTTSNNDAK